VGTADIFPATPASARQIPVRLSLVSLEASRIQVPNGNAFNLAVDRNSQFWHFRAMIGAEF